MADEIKELRNDIEQWHADTNERMEVLNAHVFSILRQLPNEDSIQTTRGCQEARNGLNRILAGLAAALMALAGWVFWLTREIK